jgi:hypothetical protein
VTFNLSNMAACSVKTSSRLGEAEIPRRTRNEIACGAPDASIQLAKLDNYCFRLEFHAISGRPPNMTSRPLVSHRMALEFYRLAARQLKQSIEVICSNSSVDSLVGSSGSRVNFTGWPRQVASPSSHRPIHVSARQAIRS